MQQVTELTNEGRALPVGFSELFGGTEDVSAPAPLCICFWLSVNVALFQEKPPNAMLDS
jgi:hypothetical protein